LDYREGAVAGLGEAGHSDIFRELIFDNFAKIAAVTGEKEAKWAAENDAVWLDAGSKRREAESDALGDFSPDSLIFDV
jgi:hypothetical protein